ncbi:MAG: DUF1538 domain-containing protein [Oscillospiraceae bacterium]|nr:DUF1538 domain-containing protein [Oscillospiraceae bacterium]
MRKKLEGTTKEALASVLPITVIVFLLSVFVTPMPVGALVLFLFGAVLLVFGMGLFTLGADMALMPMGEDIGIKMTSTKKLPIVVAVSFVMGVIITVAEPDLQVLAELAPGIPDFALVMTVAAGVGVYLILAIIRILLRVRLSRMLVVCYFIVFALSIFAPGDFVAVAFDSGGVTTGPITVPFIIAMGLGLASIRGDRESLEDSFGLVALCSVGPIMAVLILGICYHPENTAYVVGAVPEIVTSRDVTFEFIRSFPEYTKEVFAAGWPIIAVLGAFQLITRRYRARSLARLLIGFAYTFAGLILFLTGVNVGFIPVGRLIGGDMAASPARWLLVPLGAVIGYFIVAAEPAVHVLRKQVEEVSSGAIPGGIVQRYLSIGMAAALAVAMTRVLTGVSIYWFLLPGYAAALALTFFAPRIFTGIAFDSGGVVSGPMTSTFLLPFTIGACVDPDRIMTDAFGLVAMVAMAPLLALQLMGLTYRNRIKRAGAIAPGGESDADIIEFDEDEGERNDSDG